MEYEMGSLLLKSYPLPEPYQRKNISYVNRELYAKADELSDEEKGVLEDLIRAGINVPLCIEGFKYAVKHRVLWYSPRDKR